MVDELTTRLFSENPTANLNRAFQVQSKSLLYLAWVDQSVTPLYNLCTKLYVAYNFQVEILDNCDHVLAFIIHVI